MSFLTPSLLLGLIGVCIPVLIHLWYRRRARRVAWGAMQFFGRPVVPAGRIGSKVFARLLMASRVLAVALAALALAQPQLSSGPLPKAWAEGAPVAVALVIDHSVSTGRSSGGETVFDRATVLADSVLRQLRSNDAACVVLAEHAPRLLEPGMAGGADVAAIETLRADLRRQKPGSTDGSIASAVALARRTLAGAAGSQRVVLVISDGQRTSWQPADEAAWKSVADATSPPAGTYFLAIDPDADYANASVGVPRVEPNVLGIGRAMRVVAQVSNTGTRPLRPLSARLRIDGAEVDNQPVPALAAKASTDVAFDLPAGIATPGSHRIKVEVNAADALQADNESAATVNVLSALPVLVIDGGFGNAADLRSSLFIVAALRPDEHSIVAPTVVALATAEMTRLNDYAAVILNDVPTLPPALRTNLIDYARGGGGIWCILGQRTRPEAFAHDLAASGLFPATLRDLGRAADAGAEAVVREPTNPTVAPLVAAGRDALAGAIVRTWWNIEPTDPTTQTVIAARDGRPLILEHPVGAAGGRVVCWATGADGAWNNWNLMPNFVPLAVETVYHLAGPRLRAMPTGAVTPGAPIEWAGTHGQDVRAATVIRPDGTTVGCDVTLNNGRPTLAYADTFVPGFYTLNFEPASTPPAYAAVNVDAAELDPARLDADDVRGLVNTRSLNAATPTVSADQLPAILRPRAHDVIAWPALGLTLLAILVLESWLTFHMLRARGTAGTAASAAPFANAESAAPTSPNRKDAAA